MPKCYYTQRQRRCSMDWLNPDVIGSVLTKAAQADLTEKIVIVAVIWRLMGARVAEHFKSLEDTVKKLEVSVSEGMHQLSEVHKLLAIRLGTVEDKITQHGERITVLEEPVRG